VPCAPSPVEKGVIKKQLRRALWAGVWKIDCLYFNIDYCSFVIDLTVSVFLFTDSIHKANICSYGFFPMG